MMLPVKSKSFALLIGFIAFILVFFLNWSVNLFLTSLLRGALAFIVFYLLAVVIYFFTRHSINNKPINNSNNKISLETDEQLDLNEIYQTSKDKEAKEPTDFEPIEFVRMQLKE